MKRLLSCFILSFFSFSLHAQLQADHSCATRMQKGNKFNFTSLGKSTNLVPEEDYYDIKHLAFDFNLTDTSIYVVGNTRTTAQVVVPTMNLYAFELDSMLIIDSIILNDQYDLLGTLTSLGYIRKVTFPVTLSQGNMFNVRIRYHGTPPTGTGFFTGIMHAVAGGVDMVYTVSDPYATKDWWPSKQALQDKIDSVDMNVTVPDYCKVGSNGLLTATLIPGPGLVQYQWKTRYPIDYYLISLAIADYAEDQYYMHFTNSTDSMLIHNFFYDSVAYVTNYGVNFDSSVHMINYFSDLFGRFPFWKEKYGHCLTTLGGGMEHQTMTTIGVTDTRTIAHELCHEWFGDAVTYNQWDDVWLSEGFATYAEQLFIEHWWGTTPMKNYRTGQFNNVMSLPGGKVIVTDSTNINALFSPRLVYKKGAAVAHMLRYVAPDDSTFFAALKNYQTQHAYGMATTTDLKNAMQTAYNMNLDTFFSQWVYGEGYPRYDVSWSQAGPYVNVTLVQTTSMTSSVSLFHTPVDIRLKSPFGDTTIRVYNNQSTQTFSFMFSNWMNGVQIDPENNILDKVLSTVNVGELAKSGFTVAPNPTSDEWLIKDLEKGQALRLTDATGRTVWTGTSKAGSTVIPAQQLAPGNYILQIGDVNRGTVHLVRL